MPWVTFDRDFDWSPPDTKSKTVIAYKAGQRVLVKQQCANDAKAAGMLALSNKLSETSDLDSVFATDTEDRVRTKFSPAN